MASAREDRRLAAILSADMVGYSRLMEADEQDTIVRQKAHRGDLIDPTIAEHNGRIVSTSGDGLLVEFGSVVDATDCAMAIQRAMKEREADIPDVRRIQYRMGINLGDIVIDGEDILGDGVNVAARLQEIADADGICISGSARDQVHDKREITLEDLGEQNVKNLARPIRVFAVKLDGTKSRHDVFTPGTETPLALPEKSSIAVLPFDNVSGDSEQAYFSDGITEDIITGLSKISALFVIARNSSFKYRTPPIDVKQVSRDLGVRYILEGSVRKAGDRVRITAQLIDGATAGHLWAERYDGDLSDVFAIQDEVTAKIVAALELKLTTDEQERVAHRGTDNMEAYEWAMSGRRLSLRWNRAENARARPLLEHAIALDPTFAAAYAELALIHGLDYVFQWSESLQDSYDLCIELAKNAVVLDDAEPIAHFVLGWVYMWTGDHEASEREHRKAIQLDPNYSLSYAYLAHVTSYLGRHSEAIDLLNKAMRLDPGYNDMVLHFLAHANFMLESYEDAAEILVRRITLSPEASGEGSMFASQLLLASTYGHLGKAEEAHAAWDEILRINPDFSFDRYTQFLHYKNPEDRERLLEGFTKAGLPK